MSRPELPDPSHAKWVIAVAVSALLALPAAQQPARADRADLLERSMVLLERYRHDADTSALEAALMRARTGGGKNARHANPKRKAIAADRLRKTRDEHLRLKRKPNKTRRDKQALRKARRQLRHQRRKADYAGDHNSQTPKGTPRRRR